MSAVLTSLGSFFTQCMTWIGDVIDVIVDEPILLITIVGFTVVGFAVGLVSRLIRA